MLRSALVITLFATLVAACGSEEASLEDAGVVAPDAARADGAVEEDAGAPGPDAGAPEADAGQGEAPDAGTPEVDAGEVETPDAGARVDGGGPSSTAPCTAVVQSGGSCTGNAALPASRCLRVQVTGCPGVADSAVRLKISEPAGTPRGTIVFGTGGSGTGFYEGSGAITIQHTLLPLYTMGFRIVQRAWEGGGWLTGPGGSRRAGARGATMYDAIFRNAHTPGTPFCVTGNSGGSAEISFALAHYGMGSIIDLAVPTSGPPMGRVDYGCLPDAYPSWRTECASLRTCGNPCGYVGPALLFMDQLFGTNACSAHDPSAAADFLDGSVLNPNATLDYPETEVRFVYGGMDCSEAVPLGRVYANAVTSAKVITIVPGVQHAVMEYEAGADRITQDLVEGCVLRH